LFWLDPRQDVNKTYKLGIQLLAMDFKASLSQITYVYMFQAINKDYLLKHEEL